LLRLANEDAQAQAAEVAAERASSPGLTSNRMPRCVRSLMNAWLPARSGLASMAARSCRCGRRRSCMLTR
jgi:hypothetical protein